MSRNYICEYGNCDNETVKITVTSKHDGILSRFCSWEHLAWWAAKQADWREVQPRIAKENAARYDAGSSASPHTKDETR